LHAGNPVIDNFNCQDGKDCLEEFSFHDSSTRRPQRPRGNQDEANRTRGTREAEQIRKPDRTAASGAPRLRASRYEELAVRYLATIRIAAINEWLPRHL
jgi:hypothetical protein